MTNFIRTPDWILVNIRKPAKNKLVSFASFFALLNPLVPGVH